MEQLLAILNAIPPEAWTALGGLLAAALGGRYAWVARAAQGILTAAASEHPEDHGKQLDHVERKHGRRAAARRAAKIIRARMERERPVPAPSLVDRIHDGTTMPDALPQVGAEFPLDELTPTSRPTLPETPSSKPPPKVTP